MDEFAMYRLGVLFLGFGVFYGCDIGRQGIVVSTAPLTESQKTAIAIADAEACNCGRSADLQTKQPND